MMQTKVAHETLLPTSIYETTRRHPLEGRSLHLQSHRNVMSSQIFIAAPLKFDYLARVLLVPHSLFGHL
jgi:hypothetical protein